MSWLFGKKKPLCPACDQAVNRSQFDVQGKTLSGVKCKSCGQEYCLTCYNPAGTMLKCQKCGHEKFSFMVAE